jgi:hypothetical protein
VNALAHRFRTRLLPALLTAFGVALLGNGLLTYTTAVEPGPVALPLASFRPLPTINPVLQLPNGQNPTEPSFPPDRVATRVVIPKLQIDLPVMLQTANYGEFPLCDVALYQPLLGQPGAGRATYIYAHARDGMFLALLIASQDNNGQRMIGDVVEVFTSDNYLFLYTIAEVHRHVKDLTDAFAATTERLWLQTSEGPYSNAPKLQVVANFLSASKTDPASAHPAPHPRICV